MRKRRSVRRKRNPRNHNGIAFIIFLTILIISGICLTLLPGVDTGALKVDAMKYISGALAGTMINGQTNQSEQSDELRTADGSAGMNKSESTQTSQGEMNPSANAGEGADSVDKQSGASDKTATAEDAEFQGVLVSKGIVETHSNLKDEQAEDVKESLIERFISYAVASEFKESVDGSGEGDETNNSPIFVVSSVVSEENPEAIQKNSEPITSDIQGAVFIYHTHATESYEPYMDGNYHITSEEGTVRSVANALAAGLTAKGIKVYHDKTLHDNPTYTNSYGRSLATAQNYLAQYSDIRVMIDLHRDAKANGGKKYSIVNVNGAKATSFNIVVGNKNPNYQQLMSFANLVISKANELYPGLGGRIIEREYKFNQYLSNNYMLIEVGNNGNTIDEAMLTGTLLADVLEAVMREI